MSRGLFARFINFTLRCGVERRNTDCSLRGERDKVRINFKQQTNERDELPQYAGVKRAAAQSKQNVLK